MMRLRLSTGIVLFATLLPMRARAHTPGLSMADFEVHADGEIDARLTFSMASAEPLTGAAVGRNGDGVITAGDLSRVRDNLRAFVTDEVEVAADGSSCDGTFVDATLSEVDGLELQAKYTCRPGPAEVQVTLYYLSNATAGRVRKGIARIVAGSATSEGVLTAERRALSLRLPGGNKRSSRLSPHLLLVPLAAVATAWVAWRSRRWRAARAAWQNRAS